MGCHGCNGQAVYVSSDRSFCESCYVLWVNKWGCYKFWRDPEGKPCGSHFDRDVDSSRKIAMNIQGYRELPEGFKSLCIPYKAFSYVTLVLKERSELFEKILLSDYFIAYRYMNSMKISRWEELEPLMLQCAKFQLNVNRSFLDTEFHHLRDIKRYIENVLRVTGSKAVSFFKEGYNALTMYPEAILSLSVITRKRLKRKELTLFHSFQSTLRYYETHIEGTFPEFEQFLESVYDNYYSEKEGKFILGDIKKDYSLDDSIFSLKDPDLTDPLIKKCIKGRELIYSMTDPGGYIATYLNSSGKVNTKLEVFTREICQEGLEYVKNIKRGRVPSMEKTLPHKYESLGKVLEYLSYTKDLPEVQEYPELEVSLEEAILRGIGNKGYTVGIDDHGVTSILDSLIQYHSEGSIKLSDNFIRNVLSKCVDVSLKYAISCKTRFKEGEINIMKHENHRREYSKLLLKLKDKP